MEKANIEGNTPLHIACKTGHIYKNCSILFHLDSFFSAHISELQTDIIFSRSFAAQALSRTQEILNMKKVNLFCSPNNEVAKVLAFQKKFSIRRKIFQTMFILTLQVWRKPCTCFFLWQRRIGRVLTYKTTKER